MKNKMRMISRAGVQLSLTLLLGLLVGCVGYVSPGGGGVVVPVPAPEVTFYGSFHDSGPVHVYSHRGYVSRGWAHHHDGHWH